MKTKQHIHNKQIHLIDSKMTEGISKEIFHGKVASILIKINHVNRIFFFFFLIWDSIQTRLNSHYKVWSHKKNEKMKNILGQLTQKSAKNRHISSIKAISIISQKKACCGKRTPKSSCARKKTIEIHILQALKSDLPVHEYLDTRHNSVTRVS